MPYQISWYVDKRVLYQRYQGTLTATDIIAADHEATTYVDSGTPPVHIIADTSQVQKFPLNLSESTRLLSNRAKGLGWVLVISRNRALNFVISVALQVRGVDIRFVASLDEALVFLAARDQTLSLDSLRQANLEQR
jgi:hypothetical protein